MRRFVQISEVVAALFDRLVAEDCRTPRSQIEFLLIEEAKRRGWKIGKATKDRCARTR